MAETAKPKLPSWATWDKDQVIVDMDAVYPRYLGQLELEASQYATGVVKLCITRDLAEMLGIEGVMVRFKGSSGWKLEHLPHGLPQRHRIAYEEKRQAVDARLQAKEITAEEAAAEARALNEAWLSLQAHSHDEGIKDGGKFRDRLIQKRAAQALAGE